MSIDDQAGVNPELDESQKDGGADPAAADPEYIPPGGGGFGFRLPEWFYIPRLDEPIQKYMEHPLNFSKSEGMAYIVRGFSALAGGILNYWWMDVVGGFMRIRKESAAKVVKEGGDTHV
jgi:hypothetical protein